MGFRFNALTCNFDLAGASTAIAIGDSITGAAANRILRTDASANLDEVPALTAGRVVVSHATDLLQSSSVTTTELGYLSGVTGAIQTALDAKIPLTQKAANNGVATLDSGGKIPVSQLPSSIFTYEGIWNASTNTPTLTNGGGSFDNGMVYLCTVAGTVDFGAGNITFAVGDWAVYNSSLIWQKSINSNAVVSVNSQTGVVVLSTSDISEGSNQYFTDERAQDAIGTILVDSSKIDFTYSDATPSITATIVAGSLVNADFNASAAIDATKIADGSVTSTEFQYINTLSSNAQDQINTKVASVTGDIVPTSFSTANNQSSAANVTGFAFSNAVARTFRANAAVAIDATADVFESFEMLAVQKGADWYLSYDSVGDESGIVFSITTGGQIQYTSTNLSGFVSGTIKFRASVLGV